MFKLNRQTIIVIFVHSIAHFVFMFIVWRPSSALLTAAIPNCITVAVNAFDGCHTMIVFVESIRNYIGETMAKGVIIWILLI